MFQNKLYFLLFGIQMLTMGTLSLADILYGLVQNIKGKKKKAENEKYTSDEYSATKSLLSCMVDIIKMKSKNGLLSYKAYIGLNIS